MFKFLFFIGNIWYRLFNHWCLLGQTFFSGDFIVLKFKIIRNRWNNSKDR
mgnify:CR=1 FL=1|jgi:hypothetical protein